MSPEPDDRTELLSALHHTLVFAELLLEQVRRLRLALEGQRYERGGVRQVASRGSEGARADRGNPSEAGRQHDRASQPAAVGARPPRRLRVSACPAVDRVTRG